MDRTSRGSRTASASRESPTGPQTAPGSCSTAWSRRATLDVCAVNADGTGFVRLTSHPGSDGSADWSPTGGIAFVTTRFDPAGEIAVMNGDGSGVTRLGAGSSAKSRTGRPTAPGSPSAAILHLHRWRPTAPTRRGSRADRAPPGGRPTLRCRPSCRLSRDSVATTCFELTCTFDASGSTDDVGTQAIYYRGRTSASAASWRGYPDGRIQAELPQAGTYTLTLTVTPPRRERPRPRRSR